MRLLFVLSLLGCCLTSATAQAQTDSTIRLSVVAAKAPSPALRYPLLPELRDQSPGNAVVLYYRAFSPEWVTHRRPEVQKKFDAWREDTNQKPPDELRWVLNYNPLREIDKAARRTYCDWELTERMRKDGIALLLPDVPSMREFASLLSLRARFEMAAGEHDKVVRTLQTGFALARHVADAPTLIQVLVGLAIQNIMLRELERWVETPGAPNLYWSLTALPSPYIDMRKPLQGERIMIDALFPGVREALVERRLPTMSPQTMLHGFRDLVLELQIRAGTDELSSLPMRAGMALYAAKVYPEAKKSLRQQGWKPDEIEAIPVSQAALLHEVISYDRIYDDMIKWYGLPYWQAREGLSRVQKQLRLSKSEYETGTVLAQLLVPAIEKVLQSGVRTDRRIAALRCVEALRLHAAAKGDWPEKLADVKEVPIPLDPMTGQSFNYRIHNGKAILTAPPPEGEQARAHNSITYEITLKK